MSYETGTASSPVDLVQKLVTFLVSTVGWASDKSAADGLGWRAHLNLNSNHAHLRAFNAGETQPAIFAAQGTSPSLVAGIGLYTSTAFDNAAAWNQQPGSPPLQSGSSTAVLCAAIQLPAGAIQNYYFFADAAGDNVVVVIEKTVGVYVHLGWGKTLKTCGSITGGAYFFGSSSAMGASSQVLATPSAGFLTTSWTPLAHADHFGTAAGFIRVDVDTFTGKWLGISDTTTASQGYTGKNGASPIFAETAMRTEIANYATTVAADQFQQRQNSSLDARANLLPILFWGARDVSGYSPVGVVPGIFYTTGVGNGFASASIYSIGSDNYMMFPNFAVLKV